jgi:hypothetical protein
MLVGLQSRKQIHPFDLLRPQLATTGAPAPHRIGAPPSWPAGSISSIA